MLVSVDKEAKMYGAPPTWDLMQIFRGHEGRITCMDVLGSCADPDARLLTSSEDSTVKVWDLNEETCLLTYQGHAGIHSDVNAVLALPGATDLTSTERQTDRRTDRNT